MKKWIIISLSALLFFCTTSAHATDSTVTIASFNVQVFGKAKAGQPDVMQVLADTITQFDIVLSQR